MTPTAANDFRNDMLARARKLDADRKAGKLRESKGRLVRVSGGEAGK